jgi:hypothetical protein
MKLISTLFLTVATIVIAHAQSSVISATVVLNSGTGQNWDIPTFPTNTATLNNGNPSSALMTATGFDFTVIPATASITGFEVTINRNAEILVADSRISLVKNGVVQADNKAAVANWPLTAGTATYGSSTDVWGGGTWTLADLNANFGVAVSVIRTGTGAGNAVVNSVQLTVHYAILAPIILTSFDVSRTAENHVIINWATSTEDKVKMMYVERSGDGRNFTTIFNVTPVGARNKYTRYSVTDKTPAAGTNFYRLKEVDYDGNVYYFDMKSVSISSKIGTRFQAFYSGSDLKVNVAGIKGNFTIAVYDAGGRLLNSQQVSINSGSHQASMPTPERSGIYFVNLNGEGIKETAKIFVAK